MGQLRLLGEPPASDDHAALANLAFPQAGHTGFVAAAGLAGGQTIIGGTAASENLSLQSTAHAARGVVQVVDALRLASGLIQDSGGNPRIALATASPHLTLTGDAKVTNYLTAGNTTPAQTAVIAAQHNFGAVSGANYGLYVNMLASPSLGSANYVYGLFGYARYAGSATVGSAVGLKFYAQHEASGTGVVKAIDTILGSQASGTGTLASAIGIAVTGTYLGSKPTTAKGIIIGAGLAPAGVTAAYGLQVEDFAAAAVYLIEAGPSTPYLRLVGGAPPGAGLTNLYLNEGGTLRRVQWKNFSTLVAGDRVMVLV